MIGTTLGRYRILEPLGAGGMGRVFLSEDPALGRRVAIKVLPPGFASDPERRERLLKEARAASALNHPNIVTIYDVGEEAGALFVAMEVIEGKSLRDWAGASARTPAEILALARQATRALAVAHAAGLVHRDLKPENLMVRGDGLLKVLYFGLARSTAPAGEAETIAQTQPGTVLGTAPYMSPEQFLGQPAGPASDVFSLGTLLYELLTGRHPFAAENAVETMHRILQQVPEPPTRLARGLPGSLDFVLQKALAKDPARRYADARELDVDLESCESDCTRTAPPAARAGPRAIAVLPFKNIGGNPDLDYLGIGLADAVITRLASSPDLLVRGTSSIVRYDRQAVDPVHAARELDVSAVLDAAFQRAGERFRATARLVDAGTGQAMWAGKVDVRFEDIFEVQDEVALGIANALTARLKPARYVPTPAGYEAFLRSMQYVRSGSSEDFHQSMRILEELVAAEPGFADAWIRLGHVRQSFSDTGHDPDPAWFERAEEAYRRAFEIEPDHPGGRYAMGRIALVRGRKPEAYRLLGDAFRQMPNHQGVVHYLAYLYRLSNLWDFYFESEEAADAIDPTAPWPLLAVRRVQVQLGRIDDARRTTDTILRRFPEHSLAGAAVVYQLRAEGRAEEALRELDRGGDRMPGAWARHERLACLLDLGRDDEARPLVEAFDPVAWADTDFSLLQAKLYGRLGDGNRAFRFLDRAVALGNDALDIYERAEELAPLRTDPRWAALIVPMRSRVADWRREFAWPPQ
jgi:TolB-like protein